MISDWILGCIWDPMKSLFLVVFGGTAYVPPILLEATGRGRWVWEFSWCFMSRLAASSSLFLPTAGSMLVVYPPGNDHIPQRLERIFIFPNCLCMGYVTLPKSNIDTTHDGLENVSPASNMASFWVSNLNFRGGTRYSSLLCHANFNCNRRWSSLPSLKLTLPLKMDGWKMNFLLGWPNFRGYVIFREGEPSRILPTEPWEDKDMMAKIARLIASRASIGWLWYA